MSLLVYKQVQIHTTTNVALPGRSKPATFALQGWFYPVMRFVEDQSKMLCHGNENYQEDPCPYKCSAGQNRRFAELTAALRLQAGVYVDRSSSGGHTNTTMQGGSIPLPAAGLSAPLVTLRVFVDRSLLEVCGILLLAVSISNSIWNH